MLLFIERGENMSHLMNTFDMASEIAQTGVIKSAFCY